MNFISQITPITWAFIVTLILSAIAYSFKLDKRIIFFFAERDKIWAINAVARLKDELEAKKIKNRHKLLTRYIKRARELSKASNGRRMYVLEYNNGFVIVDSAKGKQWLRDNNFNSKVILSDVAVYYTPCTILTEKN